MRSELIGYVAVSAGMALAASCYAMLGGMFATAYGAWVLLAIALAGVFCVLVSFSIGELAAMFPSAPGIRTYLRAAFGNYPSLSLLYLYLAMVGMAAGVEGAVIAAVLGNVAPDVPRVAIVLSLFLAIIGMNTLGLEIPRAMQLTMTLLLIAATLFVGVSALWQHGGDLSVRRIPLEPPALLDLAATVGMAIFLFIGFEWVTPLGRNPAAYRRSIPFSMVIAIVCLIVVYGVFAAGMERQLASEKLVGNPIPQITLGAALYGNPGRYGLALVSILAMLTSFNAGLMGASRLIYGLAREGVLPAWSSRISMRTGVPFNAVAAVGAICFVLAALVIETGIYRVTGVTVAAIECFVYGALVLAALRMRRSRSAVARPFRSPLPLAVQRVIAAVLPLLAICALLSVPEMGYWPLMFIATLAAGAALLAQISLVCVSRRSSLQSKEGANP